MKRVAVIVLLAVATRVALSAPTAPQILVVEPSGGPQCVHFNSPVCNALGGQGYNFATFPNPLAPVYLPNAQRAESEANAVIAQAQATRCSKYVVEFMCFAYFPLCDQNNSRAPPVLPCKSLCEQVRSDCEPVLNATYGTRWPQWANCDNIANVVAQNHAEGVCFGKAPEVAPTQTSTQPPTSATTPPQKATQPPTSATTPPQKATQPPTSATTPPQKATQSSLCAACNAPKFTPETLELRNYTFAAMVKIQTKSTINKVTSYAVEILQYLQLQPCTTLQASPPPKKAIISISSEQCPPCFDLKPGQVYLLGGRTSGQDKSGVWSVPNEADIVSPWASEYNQKWLQLAAKNDKCQPKAVGF